MKKGSKKFILSLVSILILLLSLLSITSCDALAGLTGSGEVVIDSLNGKSPYELYKESVNQFNTSKKYGVPCNISINWNQVGDLDQCTTINIVYDGDTFFYDITEGTNLKEKVIYCNDTMYYRDENGERHSYHTKRNDAVNCTEEREHFKQIAPALPHDLPKSWFNDLEFVPEGEDEYTLRIDIDEYKSDLHESYSDFFVSGSEIKFSFKKDGKLDSIEMNHVNISGETVNILIVITWGITENIIEPLDKDEYTYKGDFEFDKGHKPGGDYREDNNDDNEESDEQENPSENEKEDSDENEKEDSDENDEYIWESSAIIIQLYENDNAGELSSGLKRYYAGKDETAHAEIDDLVRDRNEAATTATGVTPKYSYRNDFAWGQSFAEINRLVNSGDSSAPDVFCNFAYDLTSLALRGCFANLLSNEYGEGNNYFEFVKDDYVLEGDDYFDPNCGEGYFYQYMQSLAFANSDGEYDKLYCLASDYTLDVIRSMVVMPVNVKMMNGIALIDSTGDEDGDGDFDVEDFYELVWDGRWTYDVLAKYCNAVFVDNGDVPGVADINDTLGAAFGRTSELSSIGLLYSSSVNIIEKTEIDGKITYLYPEENADLVDFAEALENLFSPEKSPYGAVGITSVTKAEVNNAGLGDSSSQGDLVGIRQQFANNKMLFGGIIMVGHLEEQAYQDMRDMSLGFGIVPVPLYQEGDEYLTPVHNLARVVAISSSTTKFEQCTAFLDYQSTHSRDILDAYYEQELVERTSSGLAGNQNKRMLTYIRNHVRDCFDKTYEDVISEYLAANGDKQAMNNRWHVLFKNCRFMYSGIRFSYDSYYTVKDDELKTVLEEWNELPVQNKEDYPQEDEGNKNDENENVGSLEFVTNGDGTCYVSGIGTCTDTNIVIPAEYNGKLVKEIGENAFYNCDLLTSIEIPDSVTSIGVTAFFECNSLTSIEIPDSVTSIGGAAFCCCYSLTSIVIPDGVTSIGDSAFFECYSLTSITVDENNESYKSLDGNLYTKDGKTLIQYAIGKEDTEFIIPDGVTTIGCAFSCCDSLTSVVIGNGVTSIGDSAFFECRSLTSIVIPDSVTSIGDSAFTSCSFKYIEIPNSVTNIGDSAFSWCSLKSIEIPDSITSIADSTFEYCFSLESVIIPDSVTSISNGAFYQCDSLTDVYYTGSEEEWTAVTIESGNECLTNATIHYNYVPEE